MKSEIKNCQNCKHDFTIEPDDFSFYEKIKVPPPTFCPECRSIRRMVLRNERSLYKRSCDLCKKDMISMYHKGTVFPVYCKECWYSDKWDAESFGRDYNFSKPFFEQFRELIDIAPRMSLWQRSTINSPYSNMVGEAKNVYLSTSVVLNSENVFYSKTVDKSSNIFDCINLKECDSCYEVTDGEKNYNSFYLKLSKNCLDSYFLVDCTNCSNCFMSSNLRNKKFYFRNTQYSETDYLKEIENLKLGCRKSQEELFTEFQNICKKAIYRFANIFKSVNSFGNNLLNTKNCSLCFDTYNAEDLKYCYRCLNMKDSRDTFFGGWSELMYEYTTGCKDSYNVKFSYSAMNQVRNADYIDSCTDSTNLFGCIDIKNKDNVILNKVYSKEEYEVLVEKIKKHMEEMPYIDKKGRVYRYGELFPIEISPFAYNETAAQDFFPLTEEEANEKGYPWYTPEEKKYVATIKCSEIPDDIKNVDEKILHETLECSHKGKCDHKCLEVFRLTDDELKFYKKHNIPIPNKCPNCRYYERFSQMLPVHLWHRKCMKEGCSNEFETPYAPTRPETVYCERCYQQEVY